MIAGDGFSADQICRKTFKRDVAAVGTNRKAKVVRRLTIAAIGGNGICIHADQGGICIAEGIFELNSNVGWKQPLAESAGMIEVGCDRCQIADHGARAHCNFIEIGSEARGIGKNCRELICQIEDIRESFLYLVHHCLETFGDGRRFIGRKRINLF